ncbi:hypothetical protein KKG36_01570 [Patescibacteria group bacterium]|nr:hypothetical protein [Patescibacteria group bacterium]
MIKKLQDLPLEKRKMILWGAVVLLGLIFLIFWFKTTVYRLQKMGDFGEALAPAGEIINEAGENFNDVMEGANFLEMTPEELEQLKADASPEELEEIQKMMGE